MSHPIKTRLLVAAALLAGVATMPAHCQLLGRAGGLGNVGGTLSNGVGGTAGLGRTTGSLSNNVTGSGGVTASKSIDPRSGKVGADAGLAGTISHGTDAAIGNDALAGSVATSGTTTIDRSAGTSAQLIGTDRVAGTVAGARNRVASGAGTVRDRASGAAGRAGLATTNATGDLAGSVAGAGVAGTGSGSATASAAPRR